MTFVPDVYRLTSGANYYVKYSSRPESWDTFAEGQIVVPTGVQELDYIEIFCSRGLVWIYFGHHMEKL